MTDGVPSRSEDGYGSAGGLQYLGRTARRSLHGDTPAVAEAAP
jgi:hypothetical protein